MIESDEWCSAGRARDTPWRRAVDVFDDYDRGGALTEAMADDLINELAGLGPRSRRPRRAPLRQGPQPSRPVSPPAPGTPVVTRPRLTLVRGGA